MSPLADASNEPIRVLYVNDDAEFTELVETKLRATGFGFDCRTATRADAALDELSTGRVDCVVTAQSLADTDGLQLTAAIRERDDEIPVILFSGQGSGGLADEAARVGVSDYIPLRADRDNFALLARRVRTLSNAARARRDADRARTQRDRVLERTSDGVLAVDGEWRIEYANEQFAERLGRAPDELVGTGFWEAFPSVRGTELEATLRTAMERGEAASVDRGRTTPFGDNVDLRVFPDDDGLTVFSQASATDRGRTRTQRLDAERSETVLEQIHDVVFILDADRTVQFANAAAARLLGATGPSALVGSQLGSLVGRHVSDDDASEFVRAVADTLDAAESDGGTTGLYDADLQVDFTDGSGTRTFDVRLTPFRRAGESNALVVARDVTERSDAQRQLERERDALRELQSVMAAETPSPDERLSSLIAVGCRTLGLDIGIVSRIDGEDYTVRAVHPSDAGIDVGDRFDLAATYCEEVVGQREVCAFTDAATAGKADHPAYREFALESYIGAPLVVDGERFGTLNFSSPSPRATPFGTLEHTFVELLSELVSAVLSRSRDRGELERQQFLFDRVQDIADIGIWEFIPATGTLEWSAGVRQIHGVDPDYEPALDDAIDFYHPDDRDRVSAAVAAAVEDGESFDLDLRLVRTDGEIRDVRAWGHPVDSDPHDGRVVRGVFQDVTEHTQQARVHKTLAEEYEALLDTSGDAIFLIDVETTDDGPSFEFTRLSTGYERATGLTTDDVRGRTPRDVFGEERGDELEANYRRCVERRAPISYREELPLGVDARFWETSLAPVIVDGDIARIVGIARNVTPQVERERALETTNQRLESLIEAAPLTITEFDADGDVVLWNRGAEEMFGWSQDEVVGDPVPFVPDDAEDEFEAHRERALQGERIRGKEVRRETKAGEQLDLLLSAAPISDPTGEVASVLAVLDDITEQKQLERDLRALQETAQALSRAQTSDEIGDIAVDAASDILGFEIAGVWEYDDRDDALLPISETATARETFESIPRLTAGESLAWQAFESGESQVYDDVLSQPGLYNPETEIHSEIQVPLGEYGLMMAGSPSTAAFSETDVDLFRILSATVEAAFARASREAKLQRQNDRLDKFASVVAHDLRNPLTVAIGFLELTQETGDTSYLSKVESAHGRMERLIEDLLALSRGATSVEQPTQIDLAALATEAWGYVDTDAATLTTADDLGAIAGDRGRLTQLFENLFRNAVEHGSTGSRDAPDDAVEHGSTGNQTSSGDAVEHGSTGSRISSDDAMEHGGRDITVTVGPLEDAAGFYVEDDGVGIPESHRGEVFDHGVTFSDTGTGFGLSIVDDIASAHGWQVDVTDGTDGGARFEFRTER
ncbi:PAS domain S-box protein [Haloferax marisrubri]|uniref:histidine kinase n=1 Tax=Haloferax marisrubri TaxID=1544719 RepID=A0A2P4NR19_9EURY|nr:PAS domain S-box protein [Haloferax marisrubri]POG55570.1 histidine kinase [Haloferax marisrubri]